MKVAAVIPCRNEARTVYGVVKEALQYVDEVVVADDNSTDDTAILARAAGAEVICNGSSLNGVGANTKRGISIVDTDIVVTLDGDGQHLASEIPNILTPILKGVADLVVGSRFMGTYEAPRYRKFGNDVIAWVYNLGHKSRVVDSQSCFRACTRRLLSRISIEERGFGFSTEVLIKARAQGFRIVEVPITCVYHKEFSWNSHMNPLKHGLSVVWSTIKWRLKEELL